MASKTPPQLVFDDGSRIMAQEETIQEYVSTRGSTPVSEFYEVERIAGELLDHHTQRKSEETYDGLRVALQFPDSMLCDAAEACWEIQETLERKIQEAGDDYLPLVFCLGDTTVGSCCPDEVAALHLEADVLVHYGHACLSPTGSLPVIYSFGFSPIDAPAVVEAIGPQINSTDTTKILLLFEVGYQHAMEDLKKKIVGKYGVEVMAGQIPRPLEANEIIDRPARSCCGNDETATKNNGCCRSKSSSVPETGQKDCSTRAEPNDSNAANGSTDAGEVAVDSAQIDERIVLGGLELCDENACTWEDISTMSILFIGDPRTSNRQYLHAMLRLLSLPDPPQQIWTYTPPEQTLSSSLPVSLSRQLQRRFYLTERARTATTFGIVVSSLSQRHAVRLVRQLQQRIQDAGKAAYTFAVGKINPAKLANFGEIDCFVLVACSEQSLLEGEREYHVPIVTPLELSIALGHLSWGERVYSLDCNDVLGATAGEIADDDVAEDGDSEEDDESDAPFFSLITGKYEQRTKRSGDDETDLKALPGKGQVAVYQSEAANFLKNREYQGLQIQAGQTEVHVAKEGQRGIASGYENDKTHSKTN